MTTYDVPAGFEPFLAAAEAAAVARQDVDRTIALELMAEAATMLHNGLVVDHLDDHDRVAVVGGLAAALSDPDPSAALRRAADRAEAEPGDLHDPKGAVGAYLAAVSVLRI